MLNECSGEEERIDSPQTSRSFQYSARNSLRSCAVHT